MFTQPTSLSTSLAALEPAPKPASPPTRQLYLADVAIGDAFTVTKVTASPHSSSWAAQLEDLGFIAGERVAVMARGLPGGDPLVVRVGLSTFALRAAEAACVQVTPLPIKQQ